MGTKNSLIFFIGLIFFVFLFINNISAATNLCYYESSAANCLTTYSGTGQVVMHLFASTDSHSELATQSHYGGVLCCNFGDGGIGCDGNNKIIGLSSVTNAHAEVPDLNVQYTKYNTFGVCYDSVTNCSSISANYNCGNETEMIYLASGLSANYTNSHVESPGLSNQSYGTKICCDVTAVQQPGNCNLTSATWQNSNVSAGTNVGITVNGEGNCGGVQVSIVVSRRGFVSGTDCNSINGCLNPSNIVFGANSNTATGAWIAGPADPSKYYFVASIVGSPTGNSVTSASPDLLVTTPIDCSSVALCSDYNTSLDCNQNNCKINVQNSIPGSIDCSNPLTPCFCSWNSSVSPPCNGAWNVTNQNLTHTKCDPNTDMCIVVNGDGVNECLPVGGVCTPPIQNYSECISTDMCGLAKGSGTPGCSFGTDCNITGVYHTVCQSGTCEIVSGDGRSECLPVGGACTSIPTNYSECIGTDMCGLVNGTGSSQCSLSSSCNNIGTGIIGTCYYTSVATDTCEEGGGYIDVNLTAQWVWNGTGVSPPCSTGYILGNDGLCHYDPQNLSSQCISEPARFQCAAQIPLPFFTIYNLIAAILIIAVIYVAIGASRKKGKKK